MAFYGNMYSQSSIPQMYNLNLNKHDKKEFSKLTKISNYINEIETIINYCKANNNFACVSYGTELLMKLNYLMELRLGSNKIIFNNATIPIGESIYRVLQLASEYINNAKYAYSSKTESDKPEVKVEEESVSESESEDD